MYRPSASGNLFSAVWYSVCDVLRTYKPYIHLVVQYYSGLTLHCMRHRLGIHLYSYIWVIILQYVVCTYIVPGNVVLLIFSCHTPQLLSYQNSISYSHTSTLLYMLHGCMYYNAHPFLTPPMEMSTWSCTYAMTCKILHLPLCHTVTR